MARIRSIKPEFWTDTAVVGRSAFARLLLIGIWNHADDFGVVKDDPEQLALQVLPRDEVDAQALVDELVEARLLLRRVAPCGTPVLVVRTWERHQKVDKRSPGRYGDPSTFAEAPAAAPPLPPNPAEPPRIPPSPAPGREGSGVEGNPSVEERGAVVPLALVDSTASPPATGDVETVFDAWRESTGKHRAVLDQKRRRVITSRLKDFPVDELVDAVKGWRHSAHHRGENDRHTVYNELELLLRDATHVEQFRDLERGATAPAGGYRIGTNGRRVMQ